MSNEFEIFGHESENVRVYYEEVGSSNYDAKDMEKTDEFTKNGTVWPLGFWEKVVQTWETVLPAQYEPGYMHIYFVMENQTGEAVYPPQWSFPYMLEIRDVIPPTISETEQIIGYLYEPIEILSLIHISEPTRPY